ncbi:MAG: bifunctional riboflavin kinase/FMN adenylyltransferase [Oscillospiraceae bacterium]|nr:bifunctional riboflavin kinase/FMN adenylyltransferase [Oscillospiraceae bacterium]
MQSVIALGFFDGVHLGHGDLLSKTATLAARTGRRALALTFDRSPGKDGRLLSSVADRVRLMHALYGLDGVVVLPFTEAFMRQPWDAFLDSLVQDYAATHFVCGWDYRFGFRGEGNSDLLQAWCASHGLGCEVLAAHRIDGVTVSSTHLKMLIEAGDMETAARFYGHPHRLSGVVQPGKQLGRTLGFPTANLLPPPELVLPKDGVYAVRAMLPMARRCAPLPGLCAGGQAMLVPTQARAPELQSFVGVCNVGTNPTVGDKQRTVETWLSGFEGELYGQELTVDFYHRLRDEKKFPSLEALKEEILRNKSQAEAYFRENPLR